MKKLAIVLALALALAACGKPAEKETPVTGTDPTAAAAPASSPSVTPAAELDPYDVYLATNPDPSLVLSREDAQTRAYLGCGVEWAPGTVDRALADAYDVCP